MKALQVFSAAQVENDLGVADVFGAAADNAAATMGSCFVQGDFNREFLTHWIGSVETIIACADWVTPHARSFFKSHGIE